MFEIASAITHFYLWQPAATHADPRNLLGLRPLPSARELTDRTTSFPAYRRRMPPSRIVMRRP